MYSYGGASSVYPDMWDEFEAPIPKDERSDMVEAYRKRLTSEDKDEQLRAAKAWSKWEGDIVTLLPSPETVEHFTSPEVAVAVSRIENHYMANNGWFEEGQLLKGVEKIRGIPGVIVQGRHDTCTPPVAAWKLKAAWPEVELNIIPDGGHLFNEPGVLDGLVPRAEGVRRSVVLAADAAGLASLSPCACRRIECAIAGGAAGAVDAAAGWPRRGHDHRPRGCHPCL